MPKNEINPLILEEYFYLINIKDSHEKYNEIFILLIFTLN